MSRPDPVVLELLRAAIDSCNFQQQLAYANTYSSNSVPTTAAGVMKLQGDLNALKDSVVRYENLCDQITINPKNISYSNLITQCASVLQKLDAESMKITTAPVENKVIQTHLFIALEHLKLAADLK